MPEKPASELTAATIISQPEVSQAVYEQIAPGSIPGSADGMGDALTTAHLNASNEK